MGTYEEGLRQNVNSWRIPPEYMEIDNCPLCNKPAEVYKWYAQTVAPQQRIIACGARFQSVLGLVERTIVSCHAPTHGIGSRRN